MGGSSSSTMLEPDGAPCADADECASGFCLPGLDGARMCCAVDCKPQPLETCGNTGQCFEGTECVRYPDGLVCDPTERCDGATRFTFRCDGGECVEGGAPCAGGLTCAPDGVTCRPTCTLDAHCANAECVTGKCLKDPGETCSDDTECTSNKCGSTGTGRCCTSMDCPYTEECGLDCDDTGACVLAPSTIACGPITVCTGGNQLEAEFCDGEGVCVESTETQPCPDHLACDGVDGCFSSCLTNDAEGDARCAEGFWCNVPWFDPDTSVCTPKGGLLALCFRNSMCLSGKCALLCVP